MVKDFLSQAEWSLPASNTQLLPSVPVVGVDEGCVLQDGTVWTSHSVVCDSQEGALMVWWGLFTLIYGCNRG